MNCNGDEKDLVLIVDDTPETLSILSEALEKEGMDTLVALEGSQALSIARKMLPDVILLDAVMPNMDGFEATKKIREFDKDIPIIALTAAVMKDTIDLTKEVGMNNHIAKPIILKELSNAISKYFNINTTSI